MSGGAVQPAISRSAKSPLLCAPDAETARRYVEQGYWPEATIYELLRRAASRSPGKTLLVDRGIRVSYAEAVDAADRLAAGLQQAGVGPGDVVSVQLPNWRQFPLLEYAVAKLGAVCNPLPPIYRYRELRFMLGLVQPKAIVIPRQFRGFDYVGMIRELRRELPCVRAVFVTEGEAPADMSPFESLLEAAPDRSAAGRIDPQGLSEIAFTSGTTGEPKGAMHTHNTNLCPLSGLVRRQRLDERDVVLMASTFGHQTGFVYGGQLPVVIGGSVVLMDTWDPVRALDLIEREGVTWIMSATPFLQDLCEAAKHHGRDKARSLRIFLCSGAPIPRSLLAQARELLGCAVVSGWGMTELGLVTLSELDDPEERVSNSDGSPQEGLSVRVLREDGSMAAADEDGDLVTRGPNLFAGYFRRPEMTAAAFTGDGWFKTGDRARLDERGYIRITGRSKDIIIRGGENIPVIEVEDLLHKHPSVRNAAVVAVPDPRLQERACAVVVPNEGCSFTFDDMVRHLEDQKLAKQYFPEFLEIADDFPMTPSGKIQKYLLREQMARLFEERRNSGRRP